MSLRTTLHFITLYLSFLLLSFFLLIVWENALESEETMANTNDETEKERLMTNEELITELQKYPLGISVQGYDGSDRICSISVYRVTLSDDDYLVVDVD